MDSFNKILEQERKQTLRQIENANKRLAQARVKKIEALSFGDLRENSAHDDAENDIGLFSYEKVVLDEKIKEIDRLENSFYRSSGYIGVKSRFSCKRNDTNEILEFYVVPAELGNAQKGLLPVNSKLGEAVQGKKKGDRCVVNTGLVAYTVDILSVE